MEKLIEMLKQGRIFLVGEFRGSRVEVIRYVDKKTGQANTFTSMTLVVERIGGAESVLVTQQLGDGVVDAATVKVNAQKGKQYAFELSGLEKVRGVLKARMPAGIDPLPV